MVWHVRIKSFVFCASMMKLQLPLEDMNRSFTDAKTSNGMSRIAVLYCWMEPLRTHRITSLYVCERS